MSSPKQDACSAYTVTSRVGQPSRFTSRALAKVCAWMDASSLEIEGGRPHGVRWRLENGAGSSSVANSGRTVRSAEPSLAVQQPPRRHLDVRVALSQGPCCRLPCDEQHQVRHRVRLHRNLRDRGGAAERHALA